MGASLFHIVTYPIGTNPCKGFPWQRDGIEKIDTQKVKTQTLTHSETQKWGGVPPPPPKKKAHPVGGGARMSKT